VSGLWNGKMRALQTTSPRVALAQRAGKNQFSTVLRVINLPLSGRNGSRIAQYLSETRRFIQSPVETLSGATSRPLQTTQLSLLPRHACPCTLGARLSPAASVTIGGSMIFRGGDFANPSERSERALRGFGLTGE